MSEPRFWHTASLLQDGKVLVAGGECTNTAEIYDPAVDTWTFTTPMNYARCEGLRADGSDAIGSVTLSDGRVLVAGMVTDSPTTVRMTTEYYDPGARTWRIGAPPPDPVGYLVMLPLRSGRVMVDITYMCGTQVTPCSLAADILDPVTDTWTSTSPIVPPRDGPVGVVLSGGLVLISGGEDDGWSFPAANIYDEDAGRWSQATSMDFPRSRLLLGALRDGEALAIGGISDCQYSPTIMDQLPAERFSVGTRGQP
jgi:hypothetical protein